MLPLLDGGGLLSKLRLAHGAALVTPVARWLHLLGESPPSLTKVLQLTSVWLWGVTTVAYAVSLSLTLPATSVRYARRALLLYAKHAPIPLNARKQSTIVW